MVVRPLKEVYRSELIAKLKEAKIKEAENVTTASERFVLYDEKRTKTPWNFVSLENSTKNLLHAINSLKFCIANIFWQPVSQEDNSVAL